MMERWRMDTACDNCPFTNSPGGSHLRKTLRPARWKQITIDLKRGAHFYCHKTTKQTGDGSNLVCAGSIEWQTKRGIVSQYVQVAERLEQFAREKNGKTT